MSQKVLILSTDEVFQGPLAVAILRRVAGGRYEVGMPGHPPPHPLLSTFKEYVAHEADHDQVRPINVARRKPLAAGDKRRL